MKWLQLNSGYQMPMLGLGTWNASTGEVGKAVSTAIEVGYKLIDCAHLYQNEKEIGVALDAILKEGKVKRKDVFIVSKLWNDCHKPSDVKPALKRTLSALKQDFLDLYLIHWPVSQKRKDDELFVKDENDVVIVEDDIDILDTWKAMEGLLRDGSVKSIGVSNFNSKQLQRILDNCKIPPAVNQIEIHPFFNNDKLVKFCQSKGVAVTAFSPFASPGRANLSLKDPNVFEEETIKKMSKRLGITPAKLALKFLLQRNIATIPKSVVPQRMKENLDVFDGDLNKADMETLMSLDCGYRAWPGDVWTHSKYFPFNEGS